MGEPRDSLVITTRRDGSKAVVRLDGELDLHASPKLTTVIDELLADGVSVVEIDAGDLTFADSAGLRAFLLARKEADNSGATLRVTRVSEPLDRVLEMTGLREVLGASPS